jgi:hypothetical protein
VKHTNLTRGEVAVAPEGRTRVREHAQAKRTQRELVLPDSSEADVEQRGVGGSSRERNAGDRTIAEDTKVVDTSIVDDGMVPDAVDVVAHLAANTTQARHDAHVAVCYREGEHGFEDMRVTCGVEGRHRGDRGQVTSEAWIGRRQERRLPVAMQVGAQEGRRWVVGKKRKKCLAMGL